MKKKRKLIIAGALFAILLVATITPTFSWLSSKTDPVVNTFAGGAISIILDESAVDAEGHKIEGGERSSGNTYKYVAGAVLDKDPTPTVLKGSEECYVFICVENELNDKFSINYDTEHWTEISSSGNKTVYGYKETVDASEAEEDIMLSPIFTQVTVSESLTSEDVKALGEKKLTATAYAVQKESLSQKEANELAISEFLSSGE